jgi:hypothetical protein
VVFPTVTSVQIRRTEVDGGNIVPRLAEPVRLQQPAFNGRQLPEIVKIVAELLRYADTSPWGNEAAVLEGLRSHIIAKNGWSFAEAEAEAIDVIRRAFNLLGRGIETRPTLEEGQPQTTIARENCKHCNAPLDDADLAAGRFYCSELCAAAAKNLASQYFAIMEARTRAHAARLRAMEAVPPRNCAHCGREFQPVGMETQYCSPACSTAAFAEANGTRRKPRPCACCGELFIPPSPDSKTCSRVCAAELIRRSIKLCAHCGGSFHPANGKSKYCCPDCAAEAKKLQGLAAREARADPNPLRM